MNRWIRTVAPLLLTGVLVAACGEQTTVGEDDTTVAGLSVGFTNLSNDQVVPPDHAFGVRASSDATLTQVTLDLEGRVVELEPRGTTTLRLSAIDDLADGTYELSASAADSAGREAEASVLFTVDATATSPDPGTGPGTGPGDGDGDGSDGGDGTDGGGGGGDGGDGTDGGDGDGTVVEGGPEVHWIEPSVGRRVASFSVPFMFEVSGDDEPLDYRVSIGGATGTTVETGTVSPSEGDTVESTFSTFRMVDGSYELHVVVTDAEGRTAEASVEVEVGSPVRIVNPEEDDALGPAEDRRMVDVLVGLSGTLPSGFGVTQIEVFISGEAADRIALVVDATGSDDVHFVYPWDTCEASAGHDPDLIGDRTLAAEVSLDTGETFLTDGVVVDFQGGCP